MFSCIRSLCQELLLLLLGNLASAHISDLAHFVSVSWWYQDSELPFTEEQPSVHIQTYWVRQSGWVVDSWLEILWQWALRMTMIPMPSGKQFVLRQRFKIHWSDRGRELIAQDRWFKTFKKAINLIPCLLAIGEAAILLSAWTLLLSYVGFS